jgi:DNA-binding beta-propeller fold protein YncE
METGQIHQINTFETWKGQIIPSTDPAGLGYNNHSGQLLVVDSEINEMAEWVEKNIFFIDLVGSQLYSSFKTIQPSQDDYEPTGIAYNPIDSAHYITNDNTKKLYQYRIAGGSLNLLQSWNLSNQPFNMNDPEGITVNPKNGHLFVCDGNGGQYKIVELQVKQSDLNLIHQFQVNPTISDPEGIAFHPGTNELYIISGPDMKVFNYKTDGEFMAAYNLSGLKPTPVAPQGGTFAPSSDDHSLWSLYITDGGVDNNDSENCQDGCIYEIRFQDPPADQ